MCAHNNHFKIVLTLVIKSVSVILQPQIKGFFQ